MEKVIAVLMRPEPDDDWCARQRAQVADALLGLGVAGLSINVRDSTVRDSLMTLTTLYPPVAAVVSLWTQQCYGEQVAAALRLLAQECDELGAYLVTESVPLTFPSLVKSGSRTPGLANIALLRRPDGLDQATWLTRWQRDHTQVAIEAQATFGYTQNWVVRALTPEAPGIAGIVEELFPVAATTDLKAFFGAADDNDLRNRISRMVASTSAFGANQNIDTVPTSRYVFRTPRIEEREMTTLNEAAALAAAERGLAVVSTVRADGTVQASLVNVGLLPHPVSGEPSLGFTTYGKVKLGNLRARPQLAVTFRNGWQWATVEGRAQLVGPDDPRPWLVDGERLRLLLREVFTAAGGTHDDWDEYDRVMAQEQRAVVLITPTRIYSNG